MKQYYLLLFAAIACEVFGTTMMKASDGFSNVMETALFIIGFVACFAFLTLALKKLPLGVAYGIWSGVGVAATAIIGVLLFGDPMNATIVAGVALIIVGVVFLETSQSKGAADTQNDGE